MPFRLWLIFLSEYEPAILRVLANVMASLSVSPALFEIFVSSSVISLNDTGLSFILEVLSSTLFTVSEALSPYYRHLRYHQTLYMTSAMLKAFVLVTRFHALTAPCSS